MRNGAENNSERMARPSETTNQPGRESTRPGQPQESETMTRRQPTADQQARLDTFGQTGDRDRDTATGAACELNRIAAGLVREVTRADSPRDWEAIAEMSSRVGDLARLATRHARRAIVRSH